MHLTLQTLGIKDLDLKDRILLNTWSVGKIVTTCNSINVNSLRLKLKIKQHYKRKMYCNQSLINGYYSGIDSTKSTAEILFVPQFRQQKQPPSDQLTHKRLVIPTQQFTFTL